MTAVNLLCPLLRWIWLFPCSFMDLYISSSLSLELWHTWPGLTVGFFHFHPWCLCCVSAALAHLPAQGRVTPKPQSSFPGLISSTGSAQRYQSPFPSLLAPCPASQLSCLSHNTLSLPHHSSEHDSGQHFHCFNPTQVTCTIDLSWAPSTPLEPHWGVLGAINPKKWALGQEEKGKTIPELLS